MTFLQSQNYRNRNKSVVADAKEWGRRVDHKWAKGMFWSDGTILYLYLSKHVQLYSKKGNFSVCKLHLNKNQSYVSLSHD